MNNNPHPMKKFISIMPILLLFYFIIQSRSASQSVNWAHIPEIKSGDHKLLLQLLTSSPYTYTQTYGVGYNFTSAPNVLIALRSMQIDYTNLTIDFKISIGGVTSTQFTTTVIASNNLPITLLYYMYLSISNSYSYTYLLYYSQNLNVQLNNSLSLSTSIVKIFNTSITQFSSARVMPYFISFSIGSNSTEYSIITTGSMINSSSFSIQIKSNSSLSRIELMIVIVDVYLYQISQYNFLDYGYLEEFNSGATYTSDFSPPAADYYNIIAGITAIRLPRQKAVSFYLMANNLYNTTTAYTYLKAEILQWRLRHCADASKPFYAQPEQLCYDNCANSAAFTYGANTNYSYCALCSSACQTCSGDGSTCLSCNSIYNRVLNNSTRTCDCIAGYFNQASFKGCPACDYTCLTCISTATTCTGCSSTRALTNSSCPCIAGTYDTQSNNATCSNCDYKCLTCQTASTSCTSCNSSSNRIFDSQNMKCPCKSGFLQNGTSICIQTPLTCTSPCVTCQITSTNCTSCDASNYRILLSSQCICKDGFTSTSITTCIEICGDGKILTSTYQCDDGNNINGDGCSSTCLIESDFKCTNSNTSSPASTCISGSGYAIASTDLIRDTSSNQVAATLAFTPIPPSTIIPYLLNLQAFLSLSSYSFNPSAGTITLNLEILQEIDASSLRVGFSGINQTASVVLQATNRLELKPYSNFELTWYTIENYLVWVLIGLLWVGSVIFIVFVDVGAFSGILELFMFVSLAWIGVEGQQKYSLLFVPLKKLRYLFGYSLSMSNQQGLFSVFNINCIIFGLPFLGFGLIVLLNKKQAYYISTRIKRFVLFDLLYGWLMINAFLIAYGLGITSNLSSLAIVDIAGIVIGCIYLVICLLTSIKLFSSKKQIEINPRLQITKKNLFRPQFYSLSMNIYILLGLIYLMIGRYLKINAIIMMGGLFLMFLLYALGNILINKMKYMLNIVILIFIYGCIMLYNNVNNAVWSGLAVTILLYIQLAINFTFFTFEKNKRTPSSELASEQAKINYETDMGVNLEREAEFDLQEQSENKSALEGQYQNHFTVYQPTIKKPPLQIMIPAPEMLYETNAIQTAMKTYSTKSDRLLDKRQMNLTTPKQRRQIEEEIGDIGGREVDMDAI